MGGGVRSGTAAHVRAAPHPRHLAQQRWAAPQGRWLLLLPLPRRFLTLGRQRRCTPSAQRRTPPPPRSRRLVAAQPLARAAHRRPLDRGHDMDLRRNCVTLPNEHSAEPGGGGHYSVPANPQRDSAVRMQYPPRALHHPSAVHSSARRSLGVEIALARGAAQQQCRLERFVSE